MAPSDASPPSTTSAPAAPNPALLSVGIVVYRSDLGLLARCLDRLAAAVRELPAAGGVRVTVVDNGPPDYSPRLAEAMDRARAAGLPFSLEVATGHGNVGYGRANNLVIERSDATFHLILNPDAELDPRALVRGIAALEGDASVVMVAATSIDPDGIEQRLCKTYPTVAILALRALGVPAGERIRARYDVLPDPSGITDVTGSLVSGSFMLCRMRALRAVGGFDPAFFLYFEDFDLSLRIAREGRLSWPRDVRMVHHGGAASRKGWRHRWLFVRGAARFFSRHGWRLW